MSTPAQTRPGLRGAILAAAVNAARTKSYREITARDVAWAAGCSKASIFWHFKTLGALRDAIAERAVEEGILPILAEMIVAKHPRATEITPTVRRAALLSLSK